MKQQHSHSRKRRFSRIATVLTVLVLAVTVLFNVVMTTLARRYGWYSSMVGEYHFTTTETAYQILETAFAADASEAPSSSKIEIVFCDLEKNLMADEYLRPMYETATALAERFPSKIELRCHDVLVNPDAVRKYQTVTDAVTGEETFTPLDTTCVVVACGERIATRTVYDFYSFQGSDLETVWAYKGERSLVGMILRVLNDAPPSVVLTTNHGEAFYDSELLMLLEDAGYTFRSMDLYKEEIPADCDLLLSFAPTADFTVDDGVAEVSEVAKIEAFLAEGGNTFLTMIDSSTPQLTNLENFLSEWGISARYHKDALSGVNDRYAVKDAENSLTSDGTTVFAEPLPGAVAARFTPEELGVGVVFRAATALKAAAGYVPQGDHVYTKGNRTMYGMYAGKDTASSFAGGVAVNGEQPLLMAITEEHPAGGTSSYVGVCASTEWVSESYLQTAVYGNPTALLGLLEKTGHDTICGLSLQPMQQTTISSITTAQMWRWTLGLTLIPALVITGTAAFVLVRRRRR